MLYVALGNHGCHEEYEVRDIQGRSRAFKETGT